MEKSETACTIFETRKGKNGALTHHGDVQLEGDVLQELEPIHVRHVHVAQHDVEVVSPLAKRR